MVECIKRQEEKRKGELHYRCLNPEAEQFRELVVLQECEGCPVRKFRPTAPPCQEQKKPGELSLPIIDHIAGFAEPCPFRYRGERSAGCSITGLPVDPDICGRCDETTRTHTAGTLDKVQNYFGAVRQWVAMGMPTRTPEEIEHLFNTHCKGCERYDIMNHACKTCGCNVSEDDSPLTNKLAMATEKCPLGRF